MRTFGRVEFAALVFLIVLGSTQNPDADPWPILFSSDASIGPDGKSNAPQNERPTSNLAAYTT